MRTLIAVALLAFGLLTTVAANAATDLPGYPDWARDAFDNKG